MFGSRLADLLSGLGQLVQEWERQKHVFFLFKFTGMTYKW